MMQLHGIDVEFFLFFFLVLSSSSKVSYVKLGAYLITSCCTRKLNITIYHLGI